MSEYTPSDEQMRDWIVTVDVLGGHGGESKARYVRWLAAHDAEVARKTLEDAADALYGNSALGIDLRNWLRARAASISTDKAGAGE